MDYDFYPDWEQEEAAWDSISNCFDKIEDEWWESEDSFISPEGVDDENNLFNILKDCKYPCLMVAFLQASQFDSDFTVTVIPHWEYVRELCSKFGHTPPEVVKLMGDISGMEDCSGTQFAEYNIRTGELTYTHYSVRAVGMFNAVRGKGKVQLTSDGQLIWEKHIPV